MSNVTDYPVTTPYGQVAGYPLNNGFHTGIDYGCPNNTPVVVNGVQIGLSNNTGASTGPHCHVGRYVNGQVTNPGVGGGFSLKAPVRVTTVSSDTTNGKYVRLTDGDGVQWVYLHLGRQDVAQGQTLQGDQNMNQVSKDAFNQLAEAAGFQFGKDFNYDGNKFISADALAQLIYGQAPRITAEDEKRVAEGATGIKNVIGKDYNSQFLGKLRVNYAQAMEDFWNAQPKAGEGEFKTLSAGKYKVE